MKCAGVSARSAAASSAARGPANIRRAMKYVSTTLIAPTVADGSRTVQSVSGNTFRNGAMQ